MKITIRTLQEMKTSGEKIAALTAYDFLTARVLDESGIDVILVGDSAANVFAGYKTTLPLTMEEMLYHTRSVARGVKHALLVSDMPFLSYQGSIDEAVTNAGRLLKDGAEGVKLEGGRIISDCVYRLSHIGIPVMGHIGLQPQSIHQAGGYHTRGESEAERKILIEDAIALEEAGAFSIVLEKIAADAAAEISKSVKIPTIGIGAGAGCDGQILVTPDMLGMNPEFHPKFVRQYAELKDTMRNAFARYIADIKNGSFPGSEESY